MSDTTNCDRATSASALVLPLPDVPSKRCVKFGETSLMTSITWRAAGRTSLPPVRRFPAEIMSISSSSKRYAMGNSNTGLLKSPSRRC